MYYIILYYIILYYILYYIILYYIILYYREDFKNAHNISDTNIYFYDN